LNAHVAKYATAIGSVLLAILASRVLILLFAARPDNPGVALLLSVSEYLRMPFAWIDTLQPVYGARFERGTVLECVILLAVLLWVRRLRRD
jgi:hypothetical protein